MWNRTGLCEEAATEEVLVSGAVFIARAVLITGVKVEVEVVRVRVGA